MKISTSNKHDDYINFTKIHIFLPEKLNDYRGLAKTNVK